MSSSFFVVYRVLCHSSDILFHIFLLASFIYSLEVVVRRYSVRKVFWEISPNSQENAAGLQLFKKRLWQWCFPVNFAKFLQTPFSLNTSRRLLLICADPSFFFVTLASYLDFPPWNFHVAVWFLKQRMFVI